MNTLSIYTYGYFRRHRFQLIRICVKIICNYLTNLTLWNTIEYTLFQQRGHTAPKRTQSTWTWPITRFRRDALQSRLPSGQVYALWGHYNFTGGVHRQNKWRRAGRIGEQGQLQQGYHRYWYLAQLHEHLHYFIRQTEWGLWVPWSKKGHICTSGEIGTTDNWH